MPNWKKVILSGSNAVLNQISASTVPGSSTNGEDLIGYDANTGGFVTITQGNLESVTDTDWHIDGNFLTSSKGVNITGSITASGGASFLDNLVLINDTHLQNYM